MCAHDCLTPPVARRTSSLREPTLKALLWDQQLPPGADTPTAGGLGSTGGPGRSPQDHRLAACSHSSQHQLCPQENCLPRGTTHIEAVPTPWH